MKKLLAHVAQTKDKQEFIVSLCEEHSKDLISEIKMDCDCDYEQCAVLPGAVENKWGYKFNRCELCPGDKKKEFLNEI